MNLEKAANRITWTLFATQSLGSAGLIAISTISSIAGANLTGQPALAGMPSTVYLLGTALSAWVWGQAMNRIGRRPAMLAGLSLGVLGSLISIYSLGLRSFPLFLLGSLLQGAMSGMQALSRFISAEVHPPQERGRAISNVVLGGTVGAVAGPLVAGPSSAWIAGFGMNELAGPFAASAGLFALGIVAVFVFLRPEPAGLSREIIRRYPEEQAANHPARPAAALLRHPAVLAALVSMAVGQMVMVMLMVITSLHMKGHQHGLGNISLVISSHTVGMFAFSLISGRLVDAWGRAPVMLTGAATLILACLLAPLSPQLIPLAVSLFLLGLGWNFCFVGGSTLLADQLSAAERAQFQGVNDLLVGLASAAGSLGSGLVFAALGFGATSLAGAALTIIPVLVVLTWRRRSRAALPAG